MKKNMSSRPHSEKDNHRNVAQTQLLVGKVIVVHGMHPRTHGCASLGRLGDLIRHELRILNVWLHLLNNGVGDVVAVVVKHVVAKLGESK